MYPKGNGAMNFMASLLTSGLSGAEHTQYIRKIKFLNASLLSLTTLSICIAVFHFIGGLEYYGFLDISVSVLSLIVFFYLRVTKNIEPASNLLLLSLIVSFQYLLITGVIGDFAILAIFLFPIISSYLKRYDHALFWNYYSVISLSLTLIMNQYGMVTIQYSYISIVILLGIYFLFFHLIFLLIQNSKVGEQTLITRSTQLYKANMLLSREIEERKKAEITLKEENVRDDAIFASIGEGMIVVDQDMIIVMVNDTAKNLLGIDKESTLGSSILNLQITDRGGKISSEPHPIQKAFETRSIITTSDFSMKNNSNSHVFPVTITASPIVIYNRPVGGVFVFRDITKEKEIDRMKTEFISLASHQLRTPLTAMKWFLEILLNDDESKNLTGEQKQYLTDINASNEREISLVNALLNISRIESGRIIIEPQMTDIKSLVEEVVKELEGKITEKHHTVTTEYKEGVGEISIDPKLTRQVYLNLLSNAIKYTPEKGTIHIVLANKDGMLLSSVQDNGYGIPKSSRKRMFERFYRAPNVFKVETEGTGLGLYLAKSIVEAEGGKIWFDSQENQGTTFYFTLPLEGVRGREGQIGLAS